MRASTLLHVTFLCIAFAVPAHAAEERSKAENKAEPATIDPKELLSNRDAELREIIWRFAQMRSNLERERRDRAEQREKLHKEIGELRQNVSLRQRTAEEITKRFAQTRDELEEERRFQAQELRVMQAEIDSIKKQAAGGEENVQETISQREREIEEITNRFAQTRDRLEQERRDHVQEIEELQKELATLKEKGANLERTVEEITKRYARTRDELEQNRRDHSDRLKGMQTEINTLKKQVAKAGGLQEKPATPKKVEHRDDATKKLAELQRELELERKTHAKLLANREAELGEIVERYARLRDSMEQMNRDFESVAVEGLNDKDPAARRLAIRMLSKIGTSGRLAGPALQKATEDPDPEVQKGAREALTKQGPPASKGK